MRTRSRVAALLTLCLVALSPSAAAQQSVPVVFVHGFKSTGGTWEAAATRLQTQLAIQSYRPSLRWQDGYSTQANQLRSLLPALAGNTILVGHSNGGIVSRQWSRTHSTAAIVTTATPHTGAPIARNASLFVGYNLQIFDRTADINSAWGIVDNPWTWILWEIADVVDNAVQIGYDSIFFLSGTLGVDAALPVWQEMRPGSSFLGELNSDANKAREASAIPTRVGFVNQARNFYWGGIFRAVAPDHADGISVALHVGADLLDYWGTYLYVRGAEDFDNYYRAETLWNLAAWMATHEEAWCQTVSDFTPFIFTSLGVCFENDSVVPTYSQVYPGGVVLERRDTSVHTRLTQDPASIDGLYNVLTTLAHVPALGSTPPSPPPAAGSGNTLTSGERLLVNERIVSGDGRYRVTYQGDGNLVLRYSDGTALWSSKTSGTTTNYTAMQTDGNAVVRNASSTAVWHSGTHGNAGAYMLAKNDGNVVILASSGAQLWQTGTAGRTGSTTSTTSGGTGVLPSGGVLTPGQRVVSPDGRFRLEYQNDGNLVLYKTGVAALWSTNTSRTSPGKVRMQSDGNLVVYNSAGTAIWASGTAGISGAYLRVQNDGNLVIYRTTGTAVWATGTRG